MAAFEDETGPDLDQFIGNKWSDWLDATQSSSNNDQETVENTSKRDVEVARLRRPDMPLFGYRPANDRFYLVVCEHCGQLVKPQSMIIHYERNHKNKRVTRITPSGSKFRPAPANVKHGTDNHRILPPKTSMQKPTGAVSLRHKMEPHPVRRSTINEKSNKFLVKSDNASENKASISSEKDKRIHTPNNHRLVRSDVKHSSLTPHSKLNTSSQHIKHHVSSTSKSNNKSGGTIQLQSLPDSQVVSTSSNHSLSKQYQRHNKSAPNIKSNSDNSHNNDRKRSDKITSETVNNKVKKLPSSHHLLVKQEHIQNKESKIFENIKIRTPSTEQRLSSNQPLVVLKKTAIPDLNATVSYASSHNKRPRPISCDADPKLSPPRSKVPALHNPGKETISHHNVPNSSLNARPKKKEKRILPLKAREYDPNKHCGVRLKDDNSHCTKSLTCKDHPLSAKRAVAGRCKKFDELMKDRSREKQKLKERAAAEAAARLAPPVAETVSSSFIQSPEPVVVTTTTVLSTSTSPQTSQSSVSSGKTKTSTSLFPRIYAAWHIDCWENEEVSDEFTKPFNSCHCVQRHPQPISTPKFFARRIGSCQTSYSRKLERQLVSLSNNVQEFGTKLQKNSKAISFTPIGATTYKDSEVKEQLPTVPFVHHNNNALMSSRSSTVSFHQHDRLPSGHSVMQQASVTQNASSFRNADIFATDNIGAKASNKNSSRTKVNRKLSNLAPPCGSNELNTIAEVDAINRSKLEQVKNLLRRTTSNNSDSGYVVANEISSTSPHLRLGDFTNDALASPIALTTNSVPMTINATTVGHQVSGNVINWSEKRNHNLARSPKGKSKSAITKYVTTSQGHIDLTRQESVDGTPQLPNGLNSIAGNVLMKHGSVTLSGNIGALTIPGDETAFTGNQITQHLKNMNSNNNFVMQNEVLLSSNSPSMKSKQFCTNQITVPEQASPVFSGTNDNSVLLNGELFSLNQTNAESNLRTIDFGGVNFQETVNLEQSHDLTNDIIQLQYAAPDRTDNILQSSKRDRRNNSTFQLAQIDQTNPTSRNRFSIDTAQGCSTSTNSNRNTDLNQNENTLGNVYM